VLTPARAHLLNHDPGLNQNLISSGTTIAQIFNQDMWERHRQLGRYWLYVSVMPSSTHPTCSPDCLLLR
jgi:ion channel-forming bestrophin family protein